ncbi:hypothetical protein IE81DRAFT_368832 [Ceraceosorus guamensis]|uniref:Uncharacterized protein n=1 Tax=Ceraceosorus guamensis TaxID=1522189 RepID=A0A316VQW0_9BASI|nr:hypothetical protein IE81DRAFT_368832 [Ceraceosorus guamensis]PWN39730.1 hypothetical protein IE81DRAFT_368832 [Ceraceosorus guamensis]
MFSTIRTRAASQASSRRTGALARSYAALRTFGTSPARLGGPGDEKPFDSNAYRGGGEAAMPGAGSVDQIADSEGAYDSKRTRPDESASKIQREKPQTDMSKTAASSQPSDLATKKGKATPSGESSSSG